MVYDVASSSEYVTLNGTQYAVSNLFEVMQKGDTKV
jgi:hypothetical protein